MPKFWTVLALVPALAAQSPTFLKSLWPALKKADCMGCHQGNGVASTTRLIFPEPGALDGEIEQFGDSLRALINTKDRAASPLLLKPTNLTAHAGGRRIAPGSPEEAALKAWVDHLATSKPLARKAVTAKSGAEKPVLRRLTHAQYDNTVRDLLGDHTFPSREFPPEDFIDGFKTQTAGQSISPILTEAYGKAAENIAANWRGKDTGPGFIRDFGRRAFRRPVRADEEKRYAALYKQGGARLVIEAMLQSPAFLFRVESTPIAAEQPYAKASRLSYALWDTMPGDEFLNAAAKGELNSEAGFEAAARAMLKDPRAKQSVDQFIAEWFRFDRVLTMVKERRAYPAFTRELAVAMTEETRRLAAELVWSDRSFMELYTAGYTFLNADLAQVYNLPPPSSEYERTPLPESGERAGVLGHGSFLALTAKPADTSITARGLFVRESFLCQKVPPPPPNVNGNLPTQSAEKPMTNRERLAVHLSNPSCASCHNLVDPIGYGLEKYDGVGARREKVKVDIPTFNRRQQAGTVELPLDASGWVAGIDKSNFSSPRELGRVLAENPQCQECVVKQFFRYVTGRHESAADKEIIDRVTADFRSSGFRFQRLMVSLVKWTQFPPRT